MTQYCRFCGSPTSDAFCGQCGKPASASAPPPSPPSPQAHTPAPTATTGRTVKILLVLVGAFMLLGALGIASAVYVVYRSKQKITQLKGEYLPTSDSEVNRPVATMKAPTGNGCPILSWQEASQILDIAWESVTYSLGEDGGGLCSFTTTPQERERFGQRQFKAGLNAISNSKNDQADPKEVQRALAGFINSLANLQVPAGDKDANDGINIRFVRKRGAEAWAKFDQMQTGANTIPGSQIGMTPVEGLGDKAYVLPEGIEVVVLKGDACFQMAFFAWPGQDKAVALAKRVADHL
jgi:hypothetical protein